MIRHIRAWLAATMVSVVALGCHNAPPTRSPAPIESERNDGPLDAAAAPDLDVPPRADADGDGIADADDRCPADPEDRDGFEDDDGCPDPDNDHDRIPDERDKCPNDPETYNGLEDTDGCPDAVLKTPRPPLPAIKPGPVSFDEGSAIVGPNSAAILDSMAAFSKAVTGFMGITLVGHAGAYERRPGELAAARAAAVRRYLVKRGVASKLIVTAPSGAAAGCEPLDTSQTERRVDVCISIGR